MLLWCVVLCCVVFCCGDGRGDKAMRTQITEALLTLNSVTILQFLRREGSERGGGSGR